MNSLSPSLPPSEQLSVLLIRLQKEWERRTSENRLATYRPYPKQAEFHALGASIRERMFMAGNQLGKTWAGAFEAAMHATGKYPDWWVGRRWDRPTMAWASGVTGESTRDNVQRLLLGRPGAHGTGTIPKADIVSIVNGRGIPDFADHIRVKHIAGGESLIYLKSYERGREKWQGETLDWLWFDEEPPQDIYTEGLTRTNSTDGMTWLTFTPLLGMSDVVSRFLMQAADDRAVVQMTIEDAEHYSPEKRRAIIASYPEYEREARANGVPVMGSGRVFPVAESEITCDPFEPGENMAVIGGMDFGWDHPFAAVKIIHDRETDIVYVCKAFRMKEATPILHVGAIKQWAKGMPWAWPHDGLQHDKGSGITLARQYKEHGLTMTGEHATHAGGGFGTEAGISAMLQRMQTRRFYVFRGLSEWFEEFRLYHREEGLIVKNRDDLMSATRVALMMLRKAVPVNMLKGPRLIETTNSDYDAGAYGR